MKTVIFKGIFGSRLYGTATENSDTDLKGVYLPDLSDLILQRVQDSITLNTETKTRNTSLDTDEQYFSLHKFFNLLHKGEMTVLDMLHTPEEKTLVQTQLWQDIREMRSCFYSKKMIGYFGYVKSQVRKYSERGRRINLIERAIAAIESAKGATRLADVAFFEDELYFTNEDDYIVVCEKTLHKTVKVDYAINVLKNSLSEYGNRAMQAKESFVDWKALSHAFRAVSQIKEIVITGDLKYPLINAKEILQLKTGQSVKSLDELLEDLSIQVSETEDLLNRSSLPEQTDRTITDNLLLNIYGTNA